MAKRAKPALGWRYPKAVKVELTQSHMAAISKAVADGFPARTDSAGIVKGICAAIVEYFKQEQIIGSAPTDAERLAAIKIVEGFSIALRKQLAPDGLDEATKDLICFSLIEHIADADLSFIERLPKDLELLEIALHYAAKNCQPNGRPNDGVLEMLALRVGNSFLNDSLGIKTHKQAKVTTYSEGPFVSLLSCVLEMVGRDEVAADKLARRALKGKSS